MELLEQMKGRVPLPDALALMLLKKPDLPVASLKAIAELFLDENQPRIRAAGAAGAARRALPVVPGGSWRDAARARRWRRSTGVCGTCHCR